MVSDRAIADARPPSTGASLSTPPGVPAAPVATAGSTDGAGDVLASEGIDRLVDAGPGEGRWCSGSGARQLGERGVEGGDQLVDLRRSDRQGRGDAQHVAPQASLADQDAAAAGAFEEEGHRPGIGDLVL